MSRLLLTCLLALTPAAFAAEGAPPRAAAPNIVFIISDDHAWTDYGFMGHKVIETPHLDRFAARSAVFERGYVPTALCRPALATFATGRSIEPGDLLEVDRVVERTAADCADALATGAVPVINSLEQAALWTTSGGGSCHLMVDTGINRLGIALAEADDPRIAALSIDILMSHLASADEKTAMNRMQAELLHEAADSIAHRRLSLANSAGIALGPDFAFDLTRPGLALYGGVPRPELAGMICPVAHIEARLLQCRDLCPGEGVGYNSTFIAPTNMRVGTVSIGYADGFMRSRGAGNALWHDGRRLAILGKVSMDMIVVDLSLAPELGVGDWLTVPWDIADAAQQNALSPYEMLTVIGGRLRRS
jgi:alanine racemase